MQKKLVVIPVLNLLVSIGLSAIAQTNVMQAEMALKKYTALEEKVVEDFTSKPPSNNDTTWWTRNIIIRKNLMNKQLDFIKQNKNLYYCFLVFKNIIAPNTFMNADSLLQFYKFTFPDSFKKTSQGKEVMEILYGRKLATSENMKAPNFNATDIHGNKIQLQNYKDKYVLINFWASWCGPCVAELPAIKKISDQYFPGKLEIITNTIDQDSSAFLKALEKYKMTDWNNIYRDFNFTKLFGGATAIPQLFLIDPDGKIIYNRGFKETDYNNLARLKKILKAKLPE